MEEVDPHAIVEVTVEFDEGEEVLIPKINEHIGSYDLNEAARYIYFLSNNIFSLFRPSRSGASLPR